MTVQQQAHRELVLAVAEAYRLPISEVDIWPTAAVRVLHRNAIKHGLINQPTCEETDDTDVLPF